MCFPVNLRNFKNTFFTEHFWVTVSESLQGFVPYRRLPKFPQSLRTRQKWSGFCIARLLELIISFRHFGKNFLKWSLPYLSLNNYN